VETVTQDGPDAARRAAHGLLLLPCFLLPALFEPLARWPFYLLAPLLAYALLVLAVPALRRTCRWLRPGHDGRAVLAATLGVVVASSSALLLFHALMRPDVTELAARLPVRELGGPLPAAVVFSVLNALMEELIFRGVLYDALEAQRGWRTAVAATAVAFGWAHLNGYPPGVVGGVLAGIYGVMLGLLRRLADGLAAPFAAHVVADATIFGIFVWAGAV
jgi:uncharacterized protein